MLHRLSGFYLIYPDKDAFYGDPRERAWLLMLTFYETGFAEISQGGSIEGGIGLGLGLTHPAILL